MALIDLSDCYDPPSIHIRPCEELDITPTSCSKTLQQIRAVVLSDGDHSPEISSIHDVTASGDTSSFRELYGFEVLEQAAEEHDSFISSVSYATRLWSQHGLSLMPPSSFEEQPPATTEKDFLNVEELNSEPNAQAQTESVTNSGRGEATDCTEDLSEDESPVKPSEDTPLIAPNVARDNDEEDSDHNDNDDTQSIGSVSEFHDSLPVVTTASTPHAKHNMPARDLNNFDDVSERTEKSEEKRNNSRDSKVVRQLFLPSSEESSQVQSSAEQEGRIPHRKKSTTDSKKTTASSATSTSGGTRSIKPIGNRQARMHTARAVKLEDGVLATHMQSKVAELKSEIAKFKTENAKLMKSRLEYDALVKLLNKEKDEFYTERSFHLKELEERKRQEMKKVEMERKIIQKHVTFQKEDELRRIAAHNQELSTEVDNLREELRKADGRHNAVAQWLRDRIKALEADNDRLKDQNDVLSEDKQELVRQVIRLSKGGKEIPTNKQAPLTPASNADTSIIPSTPSSDAPAGLPKKAEKIKNDCEGTSSPKNVRFDPDSVQHISLNDDSLLSQAQEQVEANGTVEQRFKDGRVVRKYKNGTRKEISRDGKCSTTTYFNGDVRQVLPDKEVYYYASNQTVHTIYPDGSNVYQFANNQTEKNLVDGSREIQYGDMLIKTVYPNGDEQCKYPDGNVEYWSEKDQTRTIYFSNGEVETHTKEWKRRDFPDGSQKTVFASGRCETRMNGKSDMPLGAVLSEGKTKIVYELPHRPGHVLIKSKDRITAGDGAKFDDMAGKAAISNQTASSIFQFLNEVGIKNHFVEQYDDSSFLARRCHMIPIEFVTRRLATGSFLKRNPGVPEKHVFNPPLLETFFKDDANHDPQWSSEQIVTATFEDLNDKDFKFKLSREKLDAVLEETRAIFEILERAWKTRDCTLVDMKIEFGIDHETGEIILADIIDSDSWRLWPQGDRAKMKDKQVYREMAQVTQEGLSTVKKNFQWIANELQVIFAHEITAEAAIFMGSPSDKDHCEKIKQEIAKFGINSTLVVASAHKSTEYTLRKAAEFEGKDVPVVFVAVAGRSNGLGPVLSGNVLAPVINCPPPSPELSEDIWSSLRVPTGLGCTTVLYPGACAFAVASILALSDFKIWAYFKARQTNQKTSIILANKQ
ncbi:hypothetical protein RvY_16113 [Ramazzottius varieornatus]|uniref:PurE domain-containing protein n=1 Tax=Ramazzottius varieornatus TaxID=947166 RepID=A0A1D1W1T2_RAMVA|nr:hypothetical protein RvY_16113 [Ramazzottius varieornatus]